MPGHPYSVLGDLTITAEAAHSQADEQERGQLIKEISQSRPEYFARNQFGKDIKYETAGLNEESIERLREIAAFMTEQRRVMALPKEELQTTMRKQARAQQQALYDSRYPKLPTTYVPRGQVVAIPLDAATLKRIVKTDFEEFKRISRIYGTEQVTERLQGN